MARNAADCAAVLAAIAGADPNDPTALQDAVPDYLAGLDRGIRGVRLGVAEAYAFDGLDSAVAATLSRARETLIALGAQPVSVTFPPIDDALTAWGVICAVEAAIAHAPTFPRRAAEYGPALAAFLESASGISATQFAEANLVRARFAGRVAAMFADIDMLLIPVFTGPVPDSDDWASAAQGDVARLLRYNGEFNLTRQPAITLNGGFDKRGVPVGFQLVGKALSEDLLLRAAHAYQSLTAWHNQTPNLP
jgi:amidase